MDIRVGQGLDVHRFSEGRDLILCGVKVPSELGLLGHSDADVATHALMDAILGALALGDIGHWFPDNDPSYKGADSLELLKQILHSSDLSPWQLSNLDITVIAQKPKLASYIQQMRETLASACEVEVGRVSVKATTTEKLGFCGREEGICAMAVVTLVQE